MKCPKKQKSTKKKKRMTKREKLALKSWLISEDAYPEEVWDYAVAYDPRELL